MKVFSETTTSTEVMKNNPPRWKEVISLLDLEDDTIDVVDLTADCVDALPPPARATPDILAKHRAEMKQMLSKRFGSNYHLSCVEGHSGLPGGTVYERFKEAHDKLNRGTKTGKTSQGAAQAGTPAAPPGPVIELVFHGTAVGNVKAILRDGLDPKRRSGQALGPGEYFAKDPLISIEYCKGGNSMLVVAVLMHNPGTTDNGGVVVVKNVAFRCPVFAVTFTKRAGASESTHAGNFAVSAGVVHVGPVPVTAAALAALQGGWGMPGMNGTRRATGRGQKLGGANRGGAAANTRRTISVTRQNERRFRRKPFRSRTTPSEARRRGRTRCTRRLRRRKKKPNAQPPRRRGRRKPRRRNARRKKAARRSVSGPRRVHATRRGRAIASTFATATTSATTRER